MYFEVFADAFFASVAAFCIAAFVWHAFGWL